MRWILVLLLSGSAFAGNDLNELDELGKRVLSYATARERKAAIQEVVPADVDPASYLLYRPGQTYTYLATSTLVRSGLVDSDYSIEVRPVSLGELGGASRVVATDNEILGLKRGHIVRRDRNAVEGAEWEMLYPIPVNGLRFKAKRPGKSQAEDFVWWYLGDFETPYGHYTRTFALFSQGRVVVYAENVGLVFYREYTPAFIGNPRRQEHFLKTVVATEGQTCSEEAAHGPGLH